MENILSSNFLLGVLLAGSSVVADDARQIAPGSKMIANPRHASAILEASATDAVSAATSNFYLTTTGPVTLLPDVSELKFSDLSANPSVRAVSNTPIGCAVSRDGGF